MAQAPVSLNPSLAFCICTFRLEHFPLLSSPLLSSPLLSFTPLSHNTVKLLDNPSESIVSQGRVAGAKRICCYVCCSAEACLFPPPQISRSFALDTSPPSSQTSHVSAFRRHCACGRGRTPGTCPAENQGKRREHSQAIDRAAARRRQVPHLDLAYGKKNRFGPHRQDGHHQPFAPGAYARTATPHRAGRIPPPSRS